MNTLPLRTMVALIIMNLVGCGHQEQVSISSATSLPAEETRDSDIERFLQVALAEDSTVVVWRSKENDKQKLEQAGKQELARLLRMFNLQNWRFPQPNSDTITNEITVPSPIPDFYVKVYHPAKDSDETVYFAQLLVFFPKKGQNGPPLFLTFFPERLTVGFDLFTQQLHEFTNWLELANHETNERPPQEIQSQ